MFARSEMVRSHHQKCANAFATILLREQQALAQHTEMTQQTRLSALSIMGAQQNFQ